MHDCYDKQAKTEHKTAMSTYLENYLESVATLPTELSRNFNLIKELDEKSAELLNNVDAYCNSYQRSTKKNMTEMYPESSIKQLRQDLQTCIEYADEKVAVAVQTYELVDKHIRRLDQDLRKFEHELEQQRKQQQQQQAQNAKANGKRAPPPPAASPQRKGPPVGLPELDMAIDPNEPTYCLCQRVSFGEMIGCDNPDCPIEWYHLQCVGLTAPVKGRWYCPVCSAKRLKEKQAKKRQEKS